MLGYYVALMWQSIFTFRYLSCELNDILIQLLFMMMVYETFGFCIVLLISKLFYILVLVYCDDL